MSTCLLLRLAGPMQAWGTQSRFGQRDTGREPSKSGVVGLLGAALGRDRSMPLDDLAALWMGVRVDREGVFARDYHTAGGGHWRGYGAREDGRYGVAKASGAKGDPVVSNRFYLADAEFHVALAGPDELLDHLAAALAAPVWPLFLGRKAFPPAPPLCLGLRDGAIEAVLSAVPWRRRWPGEPTPPDLHLVLECAPSEGAARCDVPLSFAEGDRRFALRYVRYQHLEGFAVLDPEGKEAAPCISPA